MSKQRKRSLWAWVGAIIAGCGLCCLPLFLPVLGGTVVAGAASMGALLGGLPEVMLCGVAMAVIALAVFWTIQRSRRKENATCKTGIEANGAERVSLVGNPTSHRED